MSTDFLTRRFSTATVMRAADVSKAALMTWARRGFITGEHYEGGEGPGRYRQFSFFAVVEISFAAALLRAGLGSVEDAFRAARRFAHIGHGPTGWDAEQSQLERHPGFPYPLDAGDSFLFVAGEHSVTRPCTGFQIDLRNVLPSLRSPCGFVALNATELFLQVSARLELDGRDLMDAVYAREAV